MNYYKKVINNLMSFSSFKKKNSQSLSKKLELFTSSLNDMSKTHDFWGFHEQLIILIRDHFKPDICRFYEFNKENSDLQLSHQRPDEYRSPNGIDLSNRKITTGAIRKAFLLKDIIVIDNVKKSEQENEYVNIDNRIKAEIIIPVLYLNEVIDIIILDFYHKLNKAEKRVYLILGKLFRYFTHDYYENINREKRLEFILRLKENLSTGFDETLRKFFELIHGVFGIRFLSLWLKEEVVNSEYTIEEYLVLKSFYPYKVNGEYVSVDDFENQIFKIDESNFKKVLKKKTPKIFQNHDIFNKTKSKKISDELEIDWYISYPILYENEPIGILNYTPFQKYEKEYQESYQTKIKELESYIKLFELIFKSYSLDSTENFLNGYDQIFSILMNFDDEKSSWDDLAQSLKNTMLSEACSIFIVDKDKLVLKGSTGIVHNPKYNSVFYKFGEGLTGYAFQREESFIYYEDYNKELEQIHANKFSEIISSKKTKSILFIPIKNDVENIGLIRCNNKIPSGLRFDRYTREDSLKLENISKLIADIYIKKMLIKSMTEEREKNIYSLRHEILSPILGIKRHSEWFNFYVSKFSKENWDIVKMKNKFEDIEQNIRLINVLVHSMDDLDRIIIDKQFFNIFELLRKCNIFFRSELKRNEITYIQQSYLDLPNEINGDEVHLMRVFYNLIRNSIKYCDDNESNKYIKISSNNQMADKLQLILEDNGIGIIRGEEINVFCKFIRGREASKFFPEGTGLGLAYCKYIIEQHNGKIYFESLCKPTRIVLELPK